jgi:hypothetical protein
VSGEKKEVDWERIELDYRVGNRSSRELAEMHGVSHVAINKRAKVRGWSRDLSPRIQARSDELVASSTATVTSGNQAGNLRGNHESIEIEGVGNNEVQKNNILVTSGNQPSEAEIVEAAALAVASVRLSHRDSITRYRALTTELLAELEATSMDRELFEQLGDLMLEPDDNGLDRLNEVYRKVIALPSRIDSVRKLAESLKVLIALEREAFDMNNKTSVQPKTNIFIADRESVRRVLQELDNDY